MRKARAPDETSPERKRSPGLTTIVHWFRRDLRLADNTSLLAAAHDADRVVPVFVLDDHYGLDPNVGPSRFRFLRESLEELERSLAERGGRLVVRRGPPEKALPALVSETGARCVYANAEIGPYPEARDRAVASALEEKSSTLRVFGDALLVEPDAILSGAGEPYTGYSPFAKRWQSVEKRAPGPEPARLATPALPTVPLARVQAWKNAAENPLAPRGGEAEAGRLLGRFTTDALERYATSRDRPDEDGTSVLSPHLHFGTISPRQIRAALMAAADADPRVRSGAHRFELELAWREFFHHVLFHFPRVEEESFRPAFDRIAWAEPGAALDAWKSGRTGFPFIDAGMRQLSSTHWMHNRVRMAAGSFLTKDLHLHWREGESWFNRQLADADLANNNGGWQWVAGSGTDAAPYFRIFHPVLQSKKFDPHGTYIRRFVPELARVPETKIHEPWTMTAAEQSAAGCRIGFEYPAPILDHATERLRALAMFDVIRVSPASMARPAPFAG